MIGQRCAAAGLYCVLPYHRLLSSIVVYCCWCTRSSGASLVHRRISTQTFRSAILQKKWRDQIKVAERFLELNWDTTFATFCKLHQWVVQWAVVWNIFWKHFVSQIVYFSEKLPYTVPPDQNNMFSPPPQPKIPLKMQNLSKNEIFVTEKVNFYHNNGKFTFLSNRGTTKN